MLNHGCWVVTKISKFLKKHCIYHINIFEKIEIFIKKRGSQEHLIGNSSKLTYYNETIKTKLINEYHKIISLANLELDNLVNNQKEYKKFKTLIKSLTNKKIII